MTDSPSSPAARLSALLAEGRLIVMPCCFDALSAKLIEAAGFPLTFMSGFAVSATRLGLPDAKSLCDLCDGIVFIVRADETPSVDVEAALEVLDRRRLIGLVLNDADTDPERCGS